VRQKKIYEFPMPERAGIAVRRLNRCERSKRYANFGPVVK
jgi:hypothetical protein